MSVISSRFATMFQAKSRDYPIETARAFAVILLVSYHVIGAQSSGLELDYPHSLRYLADFLIDLRMPVFALIAGMVYALRPVTINKLPGFLTGKLRRLAIPGITAISIYLVADQFVQSGLITEQPIWHYYLWHFLHFWFLQALLVIMFVYCSLDVVTSGRVLLPALAITFIASACNINFDSKFMSLSQVIVLLPYFLLGITLVRYRDWFFLHRQKSIAIGGILLVIGMLWNFLILSQSGHFSMQRNDLQTLMFGVGACALAMLTLPTFPSLAVLGPYSFSIYLYHIIGTSGMRRILYRLGVDDPWLHYPLGLMAGLALPVMVHVISMRWQFTRHTVLGLRS